MAALSLIDMFLTVHDHRIKKRRMYSFELLFEQSKADMIIANANNRCCPKLHLALFHCKIQMLLLAICSIKHHLMRNISVYNGQQVFRKNNVIFHYSCS